MAQNPPRQLPNAHEADKKGTNARSSIEGRIEELRGAGGVFVNAVRATRMPMAITDPTLPGNPIVFANPAFIALSGYTMAEVLGQQPFFMNGPETDAEDAVRFREALADDHDEVIESVQYRKDGSRFVAALLLSAFKDEEGRTLHQFLSYLDVTKRVAAEERVLSRGKIITALQQSQARLETLQARQSFLLRLSDTLRPLADPLEIQAAATRTLGEHLGNVRTQYWEMEPGSETLSSVGGYARDMSRLAGRIRADDFGSHIFDAMAQGRTVIVADVAVDPAMGEEERAAYRRIDVRAFVSVPLVKAGSLVALLGVHRAEPHAWTDEEVDLIRETADRTWAAVRRARAEAALRDSEERFRTLAESMEDVFYITDLEAGALEYLSPSYERVWGRPVAELMRSLAGFTETLHPDDRAAFEECKAAQARGEAVAVEYRIIQPDGAVRWIYDRSFPVPGARGKRAAGTATDLTERKAAEAAQRAVDERLRLVVEGARDYAIFTLDAERRVVDWYAGAQHVFGFSAEEICGQDAAILYTPEDRADNVPETELALARQRGSAPNVRWHMRKDGERVFIEGHVVPLHDAAGALLGYLTIGQDITKRRRDEELLRESERRLRTLSEGIPQLVWRAAHDGQWRWASPQWTAFTGQSNEASHGQGWLETVHPDDRQSAGEAWERAKTTGEFHADYRIREAATGRYRFFQTRAAPVRDEAGTLIEWLGTSTDVQEMRELQERQGVLVAELQHRTRNLMAIVRATMEKTLRGSAGMDDFIDTYRDRLGALARVQGMLSRLNEGHRVAFDDLLRSELSAMGAIGADGQGDRITLDGPSGVRLRSGTVQTFALALHELATNAAKYGALAQPDGQLLVQWRVARDAGELRLHVLWLESGVAMPAADAAPAGTGYGRELIERALPYQLHANTTYELGPDGVRCTIDLPAPESTPTQETHSG